MLVPPHLKRQWLARRLEVTLHARFELAVTVERGGVHNRAASRVETVGFRGVNVRLSGSVTALAVDALGKRAAELRTFRLFYNGDSGYPLWHDMHPASMGRLKSRWLARS